MTREKTVRAAAARRSSNAGDRPPRYGVLAFFFDRSGSGDPELQGPPHSVGQARLILTRSGSGDPELQMFAMTPFA